MRIRLYIATSLDGFIAAPDGGVSWLEPFFDEDYGFAQFVAGISVAVMGRLTYEQVRDFGDWPHADHDVYVLASSILRDLPPRTVPWPDGAAALAEHLQSLETAGDCWLIGGGRTVREFARLDAIDEYEIFVMPVLLGDGVRLFEPPLRSGALQLESVRAWDNGVVRLVYGRAPQEAATPSPDASD